MRTAILVDGGFYRRRFQMLVGDIDPVMRADELYKYCWKHLKENDQKHELYRIFYYDCPPMDKNVYHPFLKKQVDFSKTDLHTWMCDFLNALKSKRKLALRMGKLADTQACYTLRIDAVKNLLNGKLTVENLKETDFMIKVDQKGVDMKIGLDIASLAYKKQVEKIILISGDSDFVSAAKLARREGIDFVLDPLGAKIKPDLYEHIDGLRSCDYAFTKDKTKS